MSRQNHWPSQNRLCMHLCYFIVMNAWCRLYYAHNLELLRYWPRHAHWYVISSFVRPLSWHSPLATSQNDPHSTMMCVSEFYAYIINICRLYKKMTSINENIFSLPFLDLGEAWVDQRFLAPPPSLLWILRPSWNVHFFQHIGAGFWTVRGLPHLHANMLHINVFKKTIRDMSERYGWHPYLSD